MKNNTKYFKLIVNLIFATLIISSCTSREEKVAEIIKDEMFKSLYDFESYQPIETKIDTLRQDKYGDTLIYDKVMLLNVATEKFDKLKEEFEEQKRTAEIYYPTYYSSSYNDNKFETARSKMQEALKNMDIFIGIIDSVQIEIRNREKECNNNQYGWFVTHKFRCKTKGGNSTIATYYYFMDNHCESIFRSFNDDEMSLEQYHAWIDEALKESDNNKE